VVVVPVQASGSTGRGANVLYNVVECAPFCGALADSTTGTTLLTLVLPVVVLVRTTQY
jgi:hypothetical protein